MNASKETISTNHVYVCKIKLFKRKFVAKITDEFKKSTTIWNGFFVCE